MVSPSSHVHPTRQRARLILSVLRTQHHQSTHKTHTAKTISAIGFLTQHIQFTHPASAVFSLCILVLHNDNYDDYYNYDYFEFFDI